MNKDKSVDESWKEQAEEDKSKLSEKEGQVTGEAEVSAQEHSHDQHECGCGEEHGDGGGGDFEMNFLNYVTSLGYQAMIFLGDIPHPMTNQKDKNLEQAKMLVDTLAMLKEKTAGNLSEQENTLLENSVYELQMRYMQVSQEDAAGAQEAA